MRDGNLNLLLWSQHLCGSRWAVIPLQCHDHIPRYSDESPHANLQLFRRLVQIERSRPVGPSHVHLDLAAVRQAQPLFTLGNCPSTSLMLARLLMQV